MISKQYLELVSLLDTDKESEIAQRVWELWKQLEGEGKIKECVLRILEEDGTLRAYQRIYKLAWVIFAKAQVHHMETKVSLDLSPWTAAFQEYVYSWGRFSMKRIPMEHWSDLRDEGMNLLNALIKEDKLPEYKADERFRAFIKKIVVRHEELRLKKGFSQLNTWFDE